jgi:hypothetical protein
MICDGAQPKVASHWLPVTWNVAHR